MIEENLFIPLTDVDEVLVGSADGLGHIVHLVAKSTSELDAAVRGLSAVPNVTGVLTMVTKVTA